MADICRGCVYYRSLSENSPNMKHYCNYLLDTGNTRDCPAEHCDKKTTKEEIMRRLTPEEKQEIIRLRVEENVPAKAIAEKFHLSKSAVFNIVGEWKKQWDTEKKPDTVAAVSDSEQEIVCDNIPADIIPENAGNVKPIIPEGVWEACRVRIEYLRDLIAEEQAAIDNWTAEMKEIEDFLEENKEQENG